MKKIYDKDEVNFALIWIGIYVVLSSVAENLSAAIGIEKVVTAPLNVALAIFLFTWVKKYHLEEKHGLCKYHGNAKQYLYFIPLVLLATTNLWGGVRLNFSIMETILYVVSMMCVGFLEEMIFRGFLFTAMCKGNVKIAILVSSLTFGAGHIVNLLNGRAVFETFAQVCYATAIGFAFTIMFYKGKSIWPCIVTHSVINSLSGVANGDADNFTTKIGACVFLCAVSLAYGCYLIKSVKQCDDVEK